MYGQVEPDVPVRPPVMWDPDCKEQPCSCPGHEIRTGLIVSSTWVQIAPGVEVWHNEGRTKSLDDGWFRVRRTPKEN